MKNINLNDRDLEKVFGGQSLITPPTQEEINKVLNTMIGPMLPGNPYAKRTPTNFNPERFRRADGTYNFGYVPLPFKLTPSKLN